MNLNNRFCSATSFASGLRHRIPACGRIESNKGCTKSRILSNCQQDDRSEPQGQAQRDILTGKPAGSGPPASATRHQQPSIGNPASATRYRQPGIGNPASATKHRQPGSHRMIGCRAQTGNIWNMIHAGTPEPVETAREPSRRRRRYNSSPSSSRMRLRIRRQRRYARQCVTQRRMRLRRSVHPQGSLSGPQRGSAGAQTGCCTARSESFMALMVWGRSKDKHNFPFRQHL